MPTDWISLNALTVRMPCHTQPSADGVLQVRFLRTESGSNQRRAASNVHSSRIILRQLLLFAPALHVIFLQEHIQRFPQEDGLADAFLLCGTGKALQLILSVMAGFGHHFFFPGQGNPIAAGNLGTEEGAVSEAEARVTNRAGSLNLLHQSNDSVKELQNTPLWTGRTREFRTPKVFG